MTFPTFKRSEYRKEGTRMKSFRKPVCPYCGKKVDRLTTWMLRRQGEYRCPRCRGVSTIVLDMKTSFLAVAAVITALLIFLIIRVILQKVTLWTIFWVLIPFLIFYILSVFLVRLKRPVVRKVPKRDAGKRKPSRSVPPSARWNEGDSMEHTRIL